MRLKNRMKNNSLIHKIIIVVSLAVAWLISFFAFPFLSSQRPITQSSLCKKEASSPQTKTPKNECAPPEVQSNDKSSSSDGPSNEKNADRKTEATDTKIVDCNTTPIKDYSLWNNSCRPELVIINSTNKLANSYKINLSNYAGLRVNSLICEPLSKMIKDARDQRGLNLSLSSCYRSIAVQTKLFKNNVKHKLDSGYSLETAENIASQEVARPGYSEHNAGLAVDFNGVSYDFKNTIEYAWLLENSHKYGFILRYPDGKKNITGIIFEPWHFRFVGIDAATYMKSRNLCFEEYVSLIQ